MKDNFTIMLPINRSNLPLANQCIQHLLDNSELNIVVIDENGNDTDYVKSDRISFIHEQLSEGRRPLVKIWNQCIKSCPTEYVIVASWRQRPTPDHFKTIDEKLNEGYGFVCFDSLHFYSLSKHLTTIIGFFDEGFTMGQYEDTDWFNRLKTNDIGICAGDIAEQRYIGSTYIPSMWLAGGEINKEYFDSKWIQDNSTGTLIQKREEVNFEDRKLFVNTYPERTYKKWEESILAENLMSYYKIYNKFIKNF